MDRREQAVITSVESLSEDIFDFTARLVAEPSTVGHEAGVIEVMEKELERLGLPVRRIPVDQDALRVHPGFGPMPLAPHTSHCLVSEIQPEAKTGRSALFNGHLDVVSPEPCRLWSGDPFDPLVRDGWMHGRGSGDMKSGVAAMTYAAAAIRRAGFGLAAPLTLEAVVQEECSGNGALACRAAGVDARGGLVPGPCGPRLYTAQVGVLWFKVRVGGRPGHVLEAGAGANALEKCFPLITSLRELEEELNQPPLPPPYETFDHPLNLNVGILNGGDWPSTVPADAEFHCRLSYFPGTSFASMRERITETVSRAAEQDPWLRENPPQVTFYGFRSDGHVEQTDAPPLAVLSGCHRELTGSEPEPYVSTCTTDLRAFYSFGRARGCCYGPVAENIHGADERVRRDSVLHTARAYALFAVRWCGVVE